MKNKLKIHNYAVLNYECSAKKTTDQLTDIIYVQGDQRACKIPHPSHSRIFNLLKGFQNCFSIVSCEINRSYKCICKDLYNWAFRLFRTLHCLLHVGKCFILYVKCKICLSCFELELNNKYNFLITIIPIKYGIRNLSRWFIA